MNQQSVALAELYRYLGPEMVLAAFSCLIFLGGTFRASRQTWGGIAVLGLATAFAALVLGPKWADSGSDTFIVPVIFDSFANFVRGLSILSGIVLVLLSWDELSDKYASDYHACMLILIAGLGLIGSANDLVTMFLALEMVSIPTYIMLYLPKHDNAAKEASLKYFLLSVFSSSLLLFGFSYLYGLTGATNLAVLLNTLHEAGTSGAGVPVIAAIALITIICGLGFRVTAAPFHFYAPDVYQGTSTVGAALLSYVPKIAGFVAMLKLFGFVAPSGVQSGGLLGTGLSTQVPVLLWLLAVLTMFTGNLLALLQDNIRRMLAYSSIAHAGYMLMALAAAPYLRQQSDGPDGIESLLFYLVAYGAMTLGIFAVLVQVGTGEKPIESIDDLAGLSKTHPLLAILAALFLFSLIGIPLTAGFTGKFMVFFGAMSVPEANAAPYRWLALIGAINAAIGGWYYLRIVAAMYLRNPLKPIDQPTRTPAWATVILCAILTLGLSFPPGSRFLMAWTKSAARNVPTQTASDAPARQVAER
ncbi:MAG: NADH-quinone oxidoreductase subunit N [Gemmataceae bacterium]